MIRATLHLAGLFAAGLLLQAVSPQATAAESYDNCTNYIASIPAVINKQGTWCLNKDVNTGITAGIAIDIQANNVTLDCNDFKVGGLAAGIGTRTMGINAVGRNNITVRNCSIRGFFYGMNLEGSNQLVEDNRFDGNTWIAIGVEGDASIVRRNQVTSTGGASGFTNELKALGIYTRYNVYIEDNYVSDVVAAAGSDGFAMGIHAGENASGAIYRNRVSGVAGDGIGWGNGINIWGSDRVTVNTNHLVSGIPQSVGIRCHTDMPVNNVLIESNVANGFQISSEGCLYAPEEGNTFNPLALP
jgi:hypothetical protein